jgi:uncharacterized repeat protein (TIGR03803 family)
LIARDGTLYGTTLQGGSHNFGTAFAVRATGVESILHSFQGSPDGYIPGSLTLFYGSLYGTTTLGGAGSTFPGAGTVFKLSPAKGTERIVQSFHVQYPDPFYPKNLIALGSDLYGTATGGGQGGGGGVVFKIKGGVLSVLYTFKGGQDGDSPNTLIRIGQALYGTTPYGGNSGCATPTTAGCGTIFKLTPDGTETVLYAFTGGADGARPSCLVNGGGKLFACVGGSANGTIAELRDGKIKTVYAFQGSNDGSGPNTLLHIENTLYGTTTAGGSSSDGTIFKLTEQGHETVLHAFSGADGASPSALIEGGTTLYGATFTGGASNEGTVFSYIP